MTCPQQTSFDPVVRKYACVRSSSATSKNPTPLAGVDTVA
jgi:hypothetical protein